MNARPRLRLRSPRSLWHASGLALAVGMAGAAAFGPGCGGGDAGVAGAKLPDGVRSEALAHEACDEAGRRVDVLDANNDGKADVKRVYDSGSGREVCRISDLNHDGRPDMFEYYDASGQLRRREADYDDSGVVDAIETFDAGRLARRELDTTGQHKIDTWDFFDVANGKRLRRERDANGDGRLDQWWAWDGDRVTIAFDKNGDGTPDPEATVVIGANGQPIDDAGVSLLPPDASAAIDAAPASLAVPQAVPQAGPELDAGASPQSTPIDAGSTADAGKAAPAVKEGLAPKADKKATKKP